MKNTVNSKINFILFILGFVLLSSCSNQKTEFNDQIESADLESTIHAQLLDSNNDIVTTDFLKAKWERELEDEGINIKLEKFEIIQSFNEHKGVETFFLKAKSSDGTFETGTFLVKHLNGTKIKYQLSGKTYRCQGCSTGCSLTVSGTSCYCSSCPSGVSQTCVKTETVIIDDQKQ